MQSGQQPVIVLVEDSAEMREVVVRQLGDENYSVVAFRDGESALAYLEDPATAKPSAVLLDVMLPQMDGFEVCRRIRTRYTARQLPVLMITALTSLQNPLNGLQVGANDIIVKPFRRRELLLRLQTLLTWPPQRTEPAGAAAITLRVLIVEDNEALRTMFQRVLRARNFDVAIATTGQEALALLRDSAFDVLLLDLGLPDMPGLDLLEQVRALPGGDVLRVIVVTGNTNAESSIEARLADLFLLKPVSTRDLAQLVERLGQPRL